jgi:hypothetical protein
LLGAFLATACTSAEESRTAAGGAGAASLGGAGGAAGAVGGAAGAPATGGTGGAGAAPPAENLAIIPDDWEPYDGETVSYGTGPQICFVDHEVARTAGQPSIRLEQHVDGVDMNAAREVDGRWYPVQAGDHIVAKGWMLTEHSALEEGNPNPYSGARLGIDF